MDIGIWRLRPEILAYMIERREDGWSPRRISEGIYSRFNYTITKNAVENKLARMKRDEARRPNGDRSGGEQEIGARTGMRA